MNKREELCCYQDGSVDEFIWQCKVEITSGTCIAKYERKENLSSGGMSSATAVGTLNMDKGVSRAQQQRQLVGNTQ